MAENTNIEWTDATWNPITGCSIVSPGCTNCYAMKLAGTRLKNHPSRKGLTKQVNGNHVWTGDVRLNEQWLDQPLHWRKPRMIFVCAHGDLFHEAVPDEWIDRVFAIMAICPQHIFQVLTKRADRMREYVLHMNRKKIIAHDIDTHFRELNKKHKTAFIYRSPAGVTYNMNNWPLPNVWLGASVENKEQANERTLHLINTPAAIRFLSVEPMLEEIDFEHIGNALFNRWAAVQRAMNYGLLNWEQADQSIAHPQVHWVICGGESGVNAREFNPDWARSLRNQCAAAEVPFFMKQMGGRTKAERQAIPDDLMVRQWPNLEE